MGTARLLIALLLLAFGAIDLVAWSTARLATWPQPSILLLLSLALSQSSLAAIWGGLGRAPLPWRLAGLVVVPVAWSFSLSLAGAGKAAEYLALLLAEALVILGVLSMFRAGGRRLGEQGPDEMPLVRPSGNPLQFSLGYLLSWMTSTAVVLGLLRASFHPAVFRHDAEFWWPIAWIVFSQGAMAVGALAVVFGSRPFWARATLLAGSAALGLSALDQATVGPGLANGLLCLLELLWLLAGLAVVRIAGFRLIREPASLAHTGAQVVRYSLSHNASSCPIS